MEATIKIADVKNKTTKGGKPFLDVRSEKGAWMKVWEDNQFIFHKFVVGETLDVTYTKNGDLITITGIVGQEKPNQSGGITVATNQPQQSGMAVLIERLFQKIDGLEKKVDWLVEERKTLNSLPPLEGKEGIDVKSLPF